MEFHQNLQTHSYDCYLAGVSNKHCLLPLFHLDNLLMFSLDVDPQILEP